MIMIMADEKVIKVAAVMYDVAMWDVGSRQ